MLPKRERHNSMVGRVQPKVDKPRLRATSCNRLIGNTVWGTRWRCDAAPTFYVIQDGKCLCEECAEDVKRDGLTVMRIV